MITYIKKDQPQYKANLHCHSPVSDGKLIPAGTGMGCYREVGVVHNDTEAPAGADEAVEQHA